MKRVLWALLGIYSFAVMADDTVLKLYRPFGDVEEQIAPVVKRTIAGECDSQSQLSVREDAWRCQAEGRVYDPCFVKTGKGPNAALCPSSPWAADSVLIEVSIPLINEHHSPLDMSRSFPWAIELINGEHCQAIEASQSYDSMPVRYQCTMHNRLLGSLQRCKAVWSMLEKTSDGVMSVDIKRVWF